MGNQITSKDGYDELDMDEGSLWINTPQGMINIHIGFGGVHHITSWLPHELDIKKRTLRGNMQCTKIEATFESVCEMRSEEE
jgi:hypothetical protein